ncbi:MAG: GtrA family protein [Chromatiaceae bacterium]
MSTWRVQGLRFLLVGLASNLVLYLLYLLLTRVGLGPKTAMTWLFALGTLQTFLLNQRWTFHHRGLVPTTFIKYLVSYGCGYLMNLLALLLFVDVMGLPHQLVQGALIFGVAVLLFLAQKLWVFRPATSS